MKSLTSLWSQVAQECATRCCTSATEDINTVLSRVEHEGLSFLTITLPDLGKSIQKCLDLGRVDNITSFRKDRCGELPRFLGGFLCRVFDRSSGLLLPDPDIEAVLAIRQLTLMFGKIALPCSEERERAAISRFMQCEHDVKKVDARLCDRDIADFRRVSNLLFRSLFSKVDSDIYHGRLLPKHGPGATAERLSSNQKYRSRYWTMRLEEIFPAREYLIPNERYYRSLDSVDIVEPGAEIPVRVISVPKTLKTPRIIAIEPSSMQYMQQAVSGSIIRHHERDRLLSRVIGFDDQTPNQRMACEGSMSGHLATLDLSDASDRVSNQLVRAMLSNFPHLLRAVDSTRSRKADVPGVGVIRLSKYASMGSALCFPMEAFAFTALIFLGIERSLNTSLDRKMIHSFSDSVRVFGDDLIVPVDHVHTIVQTLEHFGAVVGLDKSFWTGKFRESCGRDYFMGADVSIIRVRQVFPTRSQDATGVISLVSLRNQLYLAGYWATCKWLDNHIRKVLKYFPDVEPTSPVLGRVSFLGYQTERLDPRLHSPLVRGWMLQAKPPRDNLEGTGALLKCLLMMERRLRRIPTSAYDPVGWSISAMGFLPIQDSSQQQRDLPPVVDDEHLERSGRPKHVSIKLGWGSPH